MGRLFFEDKSAVFWKSRSFEELFLIIFLSLPDLLVIVSFS